MGSGSSVNKAVTVEHAQELVGNEWNPEEWEKLEKVDGCVPADVWNNFVNERNGRMTKTFGEGDSASMPPSTILRASWGDHGDKNMGKMDVVATIQRLVDAGGTFDVNNGVMGGDPCPGYGPKTLEIDYAEGTSSGAQPPASGTEPLSFQEGAIVPVISGGVVKAIYGHFESGKVSDVTDTVDALICQGKEWTVTNGSMGGDPCPGMGPKFVRITVGERAKPPLGNDEKNEQSLSSGVEPLSFQEGATVPVISGGVVKAIYGHFESGKVSDVTDTVDALIYQGKEWTVTNGSMGGDPCPGMGPKLVRITVGERTKPPPRNYERLPPLPQGSDGVLGQGIDYEGSSPYTGLPPVYGKNPDSMLCGHIASYRLQFPELKDRWLGFTQFARVCNIFDGGSPGDVDGYMHKQGIHFGLTGQWIQDRAAGGGKPWGSIEGGLFASKKLGKSALPKYHVAASSHRYDMYSDTAGGWGFYEVPIPTQNLSRLIVANRVILPNSGLSFESDGSNDGGMFGGGWIATPLFHGAPRTKPDGSDDSPLTWMFFAEASNYTGPICCYPPHLFTRRIDEWCRFRGEEDKNLSTEYLQCDPKTTLAHIGPCGDSIASGGEVPNLPIVFSDNNNTFWKIPKITLPPADSPLWASDFAAYPNDNYNRMHELFSCDGDYAGFEFIAHVEPNVLCNDDVEFGVKSVRDRETGRPSFHGMECDHRIDLPVSAKQEGNAILMKLKPGAPNEFSRYLKTTNRVRDIVGNGNHGERFESHWCEFIPESEAPDELKDKDYSRDAKVCGYASRAEDPAFQGHQEQCGDTTLRLEDGAMVIYRWYKFIEQPAMQQMVKEFPDFYTPEELDRVQRIVERMHTDWREKSLLKHPVASQFKLAAVENVLVIEPPPGLETGYVPIAIGTEYPEEQPDRVLTRHDNVVRW